RRSMLPLASIALQTSATKSIAGCPTRLHSVFTEGRIGVAVGTLIDREHPRIFPPLQKCHRAAESRT
ncbi:hypothetical protein, partial [Tardiphaga sp.]|uniref:hypothetical protein n=1 Tax=Tardiphaga sp. TaxID=1926292 RepID=UPI0025E6D419